MSSSLIEPIAAATTDIDEDVSPVSLAQVLASVPDPRARRGVRYPLAEVLAVVVCAVVAGSRTFTTIAEWAAHAGTSRAVTASGRVPSLATIHRVCTIVDGEALDTALTEWVRSRSAPAAVAIDGKELRGAKNGGGKRVFLLGALDHETGAVVGPEAEIGGGTVICAGAVIGPRVRIGRNSAIGPGASVIHALVGNNVIIHAGARIGSDGFGYQPSPRGHLKVPQLGRVVIQDDVEIGANTTVDRGALSDTVVGEGSKIDNLVQIAHNVVIGRHCIVVSQTGISGSTQLGDFVMLGGQVGVVGHVTIGTGAQIAASSNVKGDVPPGVRWGGSPAKPVREWFREVATLRRLAARRAADDDEGEGPNA